MYDDFTVHQAAREMYVRGLFSNGILTYWWSCSWERDKVNYTGLVMKICVTQ